MQVISLALFALGASAIPATAPESAAVAQTSSPREGMSTIASKNPAPLNVNASEPSYFDQFVTSATNFFQGWSKSLETKDAKNSKDVKDIKDTKDSKDSKDMKKDEVKKDDMKKSSSAK
ncbi:hypothetical protein DSO57_1034946 [Entomophthora muscae]|uniref:Uncharacterized protein n=1 Tax=Entomophthora muscae TaxID=34485 RepID=A0ACC2REG2_9FUNG|nr:hypothetical protein DSO57_1034946 [Entomophthora muscae]